MGCEGCSPFKCCRPLGFIRQCSSKMKSRKIVLILLGLDNAGKTSTVKGLAREPAAAECVVPTVGFASVRLKHRGYSVVIYDVGGSAKFRSIWDTYFVDVHGVMFVVDAGDSARIDESRKVLEQVLAHDKISGKPVLLLANKQDVEGALDELDTVDQLDVERLANLHRCPTLVETCCARTGGGPSRMDPGVLNGYRWLLRRIIGDYEQLNGRVERDSAEQRAAHEAVMLRRLSKRHDAEWSAPAPPDEGDPFKPIRSLVEVEAGEGDVAATPAVQVIGEPQPLDVVIAVKEQFERKMQRQKRTLRRVNRTAPSSASAGGGWLWRQRPRTAPPPTMRGGWGLELELDRVEPHPAASDVWGSASTVVLRSPHSFLQSDDDDRDVVCAAP